MDELRYSSYKLTNPKITEVSAEPLDKEYEELNKIEINDFEYLKILDNYKYMLDNQFNKILDNKRIKNKEVSILISYYISINKDTKRIKKEYKEYEKK